MRVYHSSNVIIDVLRENSSVTTSMNISKSFGMEKPGQKHYCHVFENVRIRDYPRNELSNGLLIIDINAPLVGHVDSAVTPDGEDWENYITAVELTPVKIIEY